MSQLKILQGQTAIPISIAQHLDPKPTYTSWQPRNRPVPSRGRAKADHLVATATTAVRTAPTAMHRFFEDYSSQILPHHESESHKGSPIATLNVPMTATPVSTAASSFPTMPPKAHSQSGGGITLEMMMGKQPMLPGTARHIVSGPESPQSPDSFSHADFTASSSPETSSFDKKQTSVVFPKLSASDQTASSAAKTAATKVKAKQHRRTSSVPLPSTSVSQKVTLSPSPLTMNVNTIGPTYGRSLAHKSGTHSADSRPSNGSGAITSMGMSVVRRTYSSNSIRIQQVSVGPSSFIKIKMLGKGDVGKVYLVRHKESGKLYAMKVLSKAEMIKRNKIKRVLAEQEILATANFPFHCNSVPFIPKRRETVLLYGLLPRW